MIQKSSVSGPAVEAFESDLPLTHAHPLFSPFLGGVLIHLGAKMQEVPFIALLSVL